jgi:hypothetical protein
MLNLYYPTNFKTGFGFIPAFPPAFLPEAKWDGQGFFFKNSK